MDSSILQIIPHITKSRTFSEYVSEIRRMCKIDLRDKLLDLAGQDLVNFFDFGCGIGNAGKDFFDVLEERIHQRRLPGEYIDRIFYYGIEKYVKPENSENKTISYIPETDILDLPSTLPNITLGIAFFVLPYIDKKLEALQSLEQNLDERGQIIISHFYPHQIKEVKPEWLGWEPKYWTIGNSIDPSLFFNCEIQGSLEKVIILSKGRKNEIPNFRGYLEEPTLWVRGIPKGPHAGQRISFYNT